MVTSDIIPQMRLRDLLRQGIQEENGYLSAKEAQNTMGVDAAIFQQWLARGLIPFKTVKAGKRTWRRFHIRELPRLILIAELAGHGFPIGEVVGSVDRILKFNWKYDGVPSVILWFRRSESIVFAPAVYSLPGILREHGEHDCASCVLLSFNEWKLKVERALTTIIQNRGGKHPQKLANARGKC